MRFTFFAFVLLCFSHSCEGRGTFPCTCKLAASVFTIKKTDSFFNRLATIVENQFRNTDTGVRRADEVGVAGGGRMKFEERNSTKCACLISA